MPPFESEYKDSVLPTFHGTPAIEAELNANADAAIP